MSSSSQAADAGVGEYAWVAALYWNRFAPRCWRARFLGKPCSCAGSKSAALDTATVAAEMIERRIVFFMCIGLWQTCRRARRTNFLPILQDIFLKNITFPISIGVAPTNFG